jgi:hypothetical protein
MDYIIIENLPVEENIKTMRKQASLGGNIYNRTILSKIYKEFFAYLYL